MYSLKPLRWRPSKVNADCLVANIPDGYVILIPKKGGACDLMTSYRERLRTDEYPSKADATRAARELHRKAASRYVKLIEAGKQVEP